MLTKTVSFCRCSWIENHPFGCGKMWLEKICIWQANHKKKRLNDVNYTGNAKKHEGKGLNSQKTGALCRAASKRIYTNTLLYRERESERGQSFYHPAEVFIYKLKQPDICLSASLLPLYSSPIPRRSEITLQPGSEVKVSDLCYLSSPSFLSLCARVCVCVSV